MNDPYVLEIYTQLAVFKQDLAKHDVTFSRVDRSTQDTLHSLARKLELEYEYSLQLQRVRISRIEDEQPSAIFLSGLGRISDAFGMRSLPDTPPDETILSTYTEHRLISSPDNYIEKANASTQWADHSFEGSYSSYNPDLNPALGSYCTPTELEDFDPGNETTRARRRYHGDQPIPPTLASRPSPNRTFSSFNAEVYKTKERPVNLPSVATNNDNFVLSSQNPRVFNVHGKSRRPQSADQAGSTDLAQVSERITEASQIPVASPTTTLKQIESQPADQYQNRLNFITDTSSNSLKPSAAIQRGETGNGTGRTPSRPKFAACWKCKALRKRVGE